MGWTGDPGGPLLQLGRVTLEARQATARPASGRRPDRARVGWLRPRIAARVGELERGVEVAQLDDASLERDGDDEAKIEDSRSFTTTPKTDAISMPWS